MVTGVACGRLATVVGDQPGWGSPGGPGPRVHARSSWVWEPKDRRDASSPAGTSGVGSQVPVKTVVQVVLVGVLALGTLAFARSDKHVVLSVDGTSSSVASRADTVGQLLSERGVSVGPRDQLVPSASSPLVDGQQVSLSRARLVKATVDGRTVQVWTTATTVDAALQSLGVRAFDATVSASRSASVPLTGLSLEVQLPDRITIKHDNRRTTMTTTARTVGQALTEAGVNLGRLDLVDTTRDAPLVDGTVITVTRVGVGEVRVGYAIAHDVVRRSDPSLFTGVRRVVRKGSDGRGVAVYRVVRHDGLVVRRTLLSRDVVQRPTTTVVRVGTKPRPVPQVTSLADLNWAALAACESGGNPQAVNAAGYYGLYQFSLGTWVSVGGTGNPVNASPDEQTYRAQLLFQRSGASPWPVCGPQLFS